MVYDSEKALLSLTIWAFIVVFGLLCATLQEKVMQQTHIDIVWLAQTRF